MKGLIKSMVIGVLAIVFLSSFPQKIPSSDEEPGTYYCVVYFVMENKDRYCYWAPNTECGPIHDPPWGNWGVDSNLGSRLDDHQFQGWFPSDGWLQWNSCHEHYYPPRTCWTYYNAKKTSLGCWEQETSEYLDPWGVWNEENIYAGGTEWFYLEVPEWDDG